MTFDREGTMLMRAEDEDTPLRLRKIGERLRAISVIEPGWEAMKGETRVGVITCVEPGTGFGGQDAPEPPQYEVVVEVSDGPSPPHQIAYDLAEYIAASRQDIPALLDLVRGLASWVAIAYAPSGVTTGTHPRYRPLMNIVEAAEAALKRKPSELVGESAALERPQEAQDAERLHPERRPDEDTSSSGVEDGNQGGEGLGGEETHG